MVEPFEDWLQNAMFPGSRGPVDGAGGDVAPMVRLDDAARSAGRRSSLSRCMMSVDGALPARVTADAELPCS